MLCLLEIQQANDVKKHESVMPAVQAAFHVRVSLYVVKKNLIKANITLCSLTHHQQAEIKIISNI